LVVIKSSLQVLNQAPGMSNRATMTQPGEHRALSGPLHRRPQDLPHHMGPTASSTPRHAIPELASHPRLDDRSSHLPTPRPDGSRLARPRAAPLEPLLPRSAAPPCAATPQAGWERIAELGAPTAAKRPSSAVVGRPELTPPVHALSSWSWEREDWRDEMRAEREARGIKKSVSLTIESHMS
jgi:hypothetical protein